MSHAHNQSDRDDLARFYGAGALMTAAGATVYQQRTNKRAWLAFSGTVGNFFAASRTPGVRRFFGEATDTIVAAAEALQAERPNPAAYPSWGRFG